MRTDVKNAAIAMLLALAATGCTTIQPPTPKEQISVWLSESPRSIAVEVDRQLPTVTLRSRDHHGGQRVAGGVGGAVGGGAYSILYGCMGGGPLGCVVGIIVAPVAMVAGGVAGAVSVKSTDSVQSADGAGEGPAKMNLQNTVDLPVMLENLVVANGTITGPHSLHHGLAVPDSEPGTLQLRITQIEWFGDAGEDPSLELTLRVDAVMNGAGASDTDWGSYSYKSSSHWVSTWLKNDGKLLREELRTGLNTIAQRAAADLRVKPSRQALTRVAWARKLAADPELDLWVRARNSANSQSLQKYLDAYPEGRYVQDAQKAQKRLADPYSTPTELPRREEGTCFFC